MDKLQALFNGGALTYEQLTAACSSKGIKLADLSSGEYVSKYRFDEAERLRKEAEDKAAAVKDYDPEWQAKLQAAQDDANKKIDEFKRDHALEAALKDAKVKDPVSVKAHLDQDKIKYEDGKLVGLQEQLEALQKGETTSFLFDGDVAPKLDLGAPTPGALAGAPAKGLAGAIAEHYKNQEV